MSLNINRIRGKDRFRASEIDKNVSDLPLDYQLTFDASADEQWKFEDEHIYYNDEDVNEIINESANDIHCLNNLSVGLDQYRQYVWERGSKSHGKYNGTVNALLEKILGRLGNIYDGLVGGVHFEFCDGDFWINNVNLRSVLKLYKIRPTNKARCYLFGLRNKLGLILGSQSGNPRYNGVNKEAEKLFNEISCALDKIPVDDSNLYLPAAGNY